MILVKERSELGYGIAANPVNYIADLDTFALRWRDGGDAYAIMRPETLDALRSAEVPMRVVDSDGRRVVVSRR